MEEWASPYKILTRERCKRFAVIPRSFQGYTMFSPGRQKNTFLIDSSPMDAKMTVAVPGILSGDRRVGAYVPT